MSRYNEIEEIRVSKAMRKISNVALRLNLGLDYN